MVLYHITNSSLGIPCQPVCSDSWGWSVFHPSFSSESCFGHPQAKILAHAFCPWAWCLHRSRVLPFQHPPEYAFRSSSTTNRYSRFGSRAAQELDWLKWNYHISWYLAQRMWSLMILTLFRLFLEIILCCHQMSTLADINRGELRTTSFDHPLDLT